MKNNLNSDTDKKWRKLRILGIVLIIIGLIGGILGIFVFRYVGDIFVYGGLVIIAIGVIILFVNKFLFDKK
jgi:uncharacterized protein YjeT (DUF2065 family)